MSPTDSLFLIVILGILIFMPGAGRAQDVDWLSEVNTHPGDWPRPARELRNVLHSLDGQTITTRTQWEEERVRLRDLWREFLGPMPSPPPLDAVVLRSDEIDNVTRSLVEYNGEPGIRVQAYVLKPRRATEGDTPGIVALHPTTDLTIDAIAGVAGEQSEHTGLALARAGFVVVCPRCFLWQDAGSLDDAVAQHRERHPHTTGIAKMLYDAQRGVDLLLAQPEVNPKRIGGFGHSLGAKELLYLMAFDDRVLAGVASEGGVSLESTNWDAPWYLGPACREDDFPRDHHELLALAAPRPLLIIGGEAGPGAADGRRTWPYIAAAHAAYSLYDSPPRLGLLNHGQGHPLTEESFARGIEWLTHYLSE
jgi:dienelactone hydrolase